MRRKVTQSSTIHKFKLIMERGQCAAQGCENERTSGRDHKKYCSRKCESKMKTHLAKLRRHEKAAAKASMPREQCTAQGCENERTSGKVHKKYCSRKCESKTNVSRAKLKDAGMSTAIIEEGTFKVIYCNGVKCPKVFKQTNPKQKYCSAKCRSDTASNLLSSRNKLKLTVGMCTRCNTMIDKEDYNEERRGDKSKLCLKCYKKSHRKYEEKLARCVHHTPGLTNMCSYSGCKKHAIEFERKVSTSKDKKIKRRKLNERHSYTTLCQEHTDRARRIYKETVEKNKRDKETREEREKEEERLDRLHLATLPSAHCSEETTIGERVARKERHIENMIRKAKEEKARREAEMGQ